MSYTRSELESDVERLLNQMATKLEEDAECESCGDGDVEISDKAPTVRAYVRKIADLIDDKIGLR
jgi:hypothetical protein